MSAILQPDRIDFAYIKELAKDRGCPVTDLLVLARQNDPFYVGTAGDIADAKWFADIWKRAGVTRAHLRRMHYWAVSQEGLLQANGLPFVNTDNCWSYLCNASKKARYLDLVPIGDVEDRKNPDPWIHAEYPRSTKLGFSVSVDMPSVFTPGDPNVDIYGGPGNLQPYHLELWIEKSSMNDVLSPICRRYHANLQTGEGEMSIPSILDLVQRIREADKPTRIFYISDFDPAGQSMPRAVARKLEWRLHDLGIDLDVKLRPIVLTREQVLKYKLPRTPIKESEKRAAAFEERFGEGAVELDALEALHPGELAGIIQSARKPYFNQRIEWERTSKRSRLSQAIQEQVDEIHERYQPKFEEFQAEMKKLEKKLGLAKMQEELDDIDIDTAEFQCEPAEADVFEADDWMFDSGRSYLDQLAAYRAGGKETL